MRALEQHVHSLNCEIHLETDAISFEERIRVSSVFVYDQLECLEKSIKPYETVPVENIKSFAASGEKNTVFWINQQDELFLVDQQRQTHRLTCL